MKLSDMFDSNPKYTSDKIVVKHIAVKHLPDLEPKGQGHSKKQNNLGNKNTLPLNNLSWDLFINWCATDE